MSQLSPERERELRRSAERLASLQKNPGFIILVEEIEKKRGRMKSALADRLMDPDSEIEGMQRQADYDRGFFSGASYPSQIVDAAAATLEKWDEGQNMEEPEEEEDGWSDYGQ